MISVIQNSTLPKFHINIYNLHPDTTADELREFYQPINIDDVLPIYKKNMYDLEFSNKEDALKVIEKGAGVRNILILRKLTFCLDNKKYPIPDENKYLSCIIQLI